jgi:surface-adhesin protein E
MKRFFHAAAIVAAGLVLGVAPGLRAQSPWPTIYSSTGVSVALDLDGATRNADGSYVTRTRWDYSDPRRLESKQPYTQMTEVALVKCTPVRLKRLTESFYAEGGAVVKEGSMPSEGEVQYMAWDRPKLRSDGAKAFSNVCAALAKKAKTRR